MNGNAPDYMISLMPYEITKHHYEMRSSMHDGSTAGLGLGRPSNSQRKEYLMKNLPNNRLTSEINHFCTSAKPSSWSEFTFLVLGGSRSSSLISSLFIIRSWLKESTYGDKWRCDMEPRTRQRDCPVDPAPV